MDSFSKTLVEVEARLKELGVSSVEGVYSFAKDMDYLRSTVQGAFETARNSTGQVNRAAEHKEWLRHEFGAQYEIRTAPLGGSHPGTHRRTLDRAADMARSVGGAIASSAEENIHSLMEKISWVIAQIKESSDYSKAQRMSEEVQYWRRLHGEASSYWNGLSNR